MQYTPATLIARAKEVRNDDSIVEIVVWELAEPLPPKRTDSSIGFTSARKAFAACATTMNAAKGIIAMSANVRRITTSPRSNSFSWILNAT